MRTNVHHLIEQRAASHPGASALSFKDVTLTYAQLWERVAAAAAGLVGLGLQPEERVAVFLDKRLDTVAAIFGTSLAGGAFVPVNPLLRGRQVAYILGDCQVTVLVTSPDRWQSLASDLDGNKALRQVVLVGSQVPVPVPAVDGVDVVWWDDAVATAEPIATAAVPVRIDTDIAAILYTSGSTGSPKGVVLSHRNLIVGAESVSQYLENTADDVILSVLPISFDAGFSQLTTAFGVGAHVVLMNYLLPRDVVRLCARHGVTGLTCVPPLWMQLADVAWPDEATSSMRYFANTGGRMPKPTLQTLRGHFPAADPYLMYGLTEAFRSTYLPPDQVDARPDSIGKAIPNAEILVVRPDGSRCDPGEPGELVHRGALVALGYWNDPERTAERFRPAPGRDNGWRTPEMTVWSGDTVTSDDEGYLYFVGRTDEMIKTSGYRVSPSEVEEVAYATGLVREVVALGVPDAQLGQRILLILTPHDVASFDEASLLTAMRKDLPLFMVPSRIAVLDGLPRSPNGKFDRALLHSEHS